MRQVKSREIILNNIRKALHNEPGKPISKPDFSSPIFVNNNKDLAVDFAENFIKASGIFIFCENESEFYKNLQLTLSKKKGEGILVSDSSLQKMVSAAKIQFIEYSQDKLDGNATLTDDSRVLGMEDLLNVEVGITFCECLVARTGSILVSSVQAAGRRWGIWPPTHIVVAYTSQIAYDIADGLKLIGEKYKDKLPSMISLVTGPSRTADIEKTLVLGAHGPKELILFLIEDN
ncbi:MAG: lactate utilization protein [Bacteroidetes bacterium]|nr:lactate utilization protein [Bacteroidota bacterium]